MIWWGKLGACPSNQSAEPGIRDTSVLATLDVSITQTHSP
jgi:hypothetical protein